MDNQREYYKRIHADYVLTFAEQIKLKNSVIDRTQTNSLKHLGDRAQSNVLHLNPLVRVFLFFKELATLGI